MMGGLYCTMPVGESVSQEFVLHTHCPNFHLSEVVLLLLYYEEHMEERLLGVDRVVNDV